MGLQILLISLFGITGVLSRYGIDLLVKRYTQTHFPLSTFLINLSGSFIIGAIFAYGNERAINNSFHVAIVVGFLGGLTTFSSFSWQTLQLLQNQQFSWALIYSVLSPVLGILLCWVGYSVVRGLT